MSKPVVLLDCDGVLADFIGGVLPIVAEVTGKRYTHDDVDEFDFCKALGLTTFEASVVKRAIGHSQGFARHLAVLDGAIDGVRRLSEIADVYIATSPWNSNPTWTHDREAWLWSHFEIPHARVIHTSAKHLLRGDVLIDDKTSTCVEWLDAQIDPRAIAIRWNTPHNRNDRGWWGACGTSSWDEVIKTVERSASLR